MSGKGSNGSVKKNIDDDNSDDVFGDGAVDVGRCGYGSCTPDAVQCCSNAKGFLTAYCFFVTVQGIQYINNKVSGPATSLPMD